MEAIMTIKWGKKEEEEDDGEEEKFVPPGKCSRTIQKRKTRRLKKKKRKTCSILMILSFQFIDIVMIMISCLWIDEFFHIQIECFTIEKSK